MLTEKSRNVRDSPLQHHEIENTNDKCGILTANNVEAFVRTSVPSSELNPYSVRKTIFVFGQALCFLLVELLDAVL